MRPGKGCAWAHLFPSGVTSNLKHILFCNLKQKGHQVLQSPLCLSASVVTVSTSENTQDERIEDDNRRKLLSKPIPSVVNIDSG